MLICIVEVNYAVECQKNQKDDDCKRFLWSWQALLIGDIMWTCFFTKTVLHHINILYHGVNPLKHYLSLDYVVFIIEAQQIYRLVFNELYIFWFKILPFKNDLNGNAQQYYLTYVQIWTSDEDGYEASP